MSEEAKKEAKKVEEIRQDANVSELSEKDLDQVSGGAYQLYVPVQGQKTGKTN